MSENLPPIPDGFTLEPVTPPTDVPDDLPPIPEGFVLEPPPLRYRPYSGPQSTSPEPVAEDEGRGLVGTIKNLGAGIGEGTTELAGGLVKTVGTVAGTVLEKLQDAGQEIEARERASGKKQPQFIEDFYKRQDAAHEGVEPVTIDIAGDAENVSKALSDVDLGYEEMTSWEDVKEAPIRNTLKFALEKGVVSAPDMVAAILSLPVYAASRTGVLARERAANKDLDEAGLLEVVETMPIAMASALLERVGAKGVFGLDDAVGSIGSRALKAGVKEAGTEAIQEGMEYAGTTARTEAEFDNAELANRMAAGAVAGGGFGGAVGGGVAVGEKIAGKRAGDVDPEAVPIARPVDEEPQDQNAVDGSPPMAPPAEQPEAEVGGPPAPLPELPAATDPELEPEIAAQPDTDTVTAQDRDLLRRAGYVDEDIDIMATEEIAVERDRAIAAGLEPREIGEGTRQKPVRAEAPQDVDIATQQVETAPTDAQKQAGNYRKGHAKILGHDVTIENPRGSVRSGTAPDGSRWEVEMPNHYGYIKRTKGADGDHVDVYVGDTLDPDAQVFVVDQVNPDNRAFDEHKAMMGFATEQEARQAYRAGFSDGRGFERMGAITPMSQGDFKNWLADPKTTDQPVNAEATQPIQQSNRSRQTINRTNDAGIPVLKSGRVKRPPTLLEFLAKQGGIRDSLNTGELRARDLNTRMAPGAGRLVTRKGMPLDAATQLAQQKGFLSDGMTLLDALDRDVRYRDQFSTENSDWVEAYQQDQAVQTEQDRFEAFDPDSADAQFVYNWMMANGYNGTKGDEFSRYVAEIADRFGGSLEDAVDQATREWDTANDAGPSNLTEADEKALASFLGAYEAIGFEPDARPEAENDDTRAASGDGALQRASSQPVEKPGTQSDTETVRDAASVRSENPAESQRQEGDRSGPEQSPAVSQPEVNPKPAKAKAESAPKSPENEPGADGKPQTVIPGTERISDREQAERLMEGKKRSTAPQKDAGGLFSDDKDQSDLVEQSRKPDGNEPLFAPAVRVSPDQQSRISQIVRRVSGLTDAQFQDRIMVGDGFAQWGSNASEAAGMYDPAVDAITISMAEGRTDTAYHESFHRLQTLFLSDQEKRVLAAETDRLRQIVATGSDHANLAPSMSQIELEAEAFAVWAQQMDANGASGIRLHTGVRRAWARIRNMVKRVQNYLRGNGFRTAQDVFVDAKAGKIARRAETRSGTAAEPQYEPMVERVPDGIPPRRAPASLLTQRLSKSLQSGVSMFKGMADPDRRTKDDGETAGEYMHRKWVDYLHPVYMMQKKVGAKLSELNDVYLNARLAEDTALSAIQTLHGKYVDPMVEKLSAAGASLEDVHRYMYALHAKERNRVIGARNPKGSDFHKAITDPSIVGASGMSTNEAKAILREMRADKAKFPAIRDAANDMRTMLDESLKNDRAAGLIPADVYDMLANRWKNYVPLRPEDGQDAMGNWSASGGFDIRGDEYKTAMGRFSQDDNVIANSVTQAEGQILRQSKNDVGKAALRLINQFDPEGNNIAEVYWLNDADASLSNIVKAKSLKKRRINKQGKVEAVTVNNPFSGEEDVFAAKVGGKVYYMHFRDIKVGHALKRMSAAELGTVSKLVRNVTVWQSIVNTRANPAFTPINVIRDMQSGAIHLLDEGFSAGQVAGVVSDIPKAWKAIWKQGKGEKGESEWDKYAQEYFDNGGKITFHGYSTLEENLKKLQKDMRRAVEGENQVIATGKAIWDFVERLNDAGENGIRLAAYVAARKQQNRTAKEAAFMARDLTVDFKKKGEFGPTMNSWFVFFNAALQGNYNIARRMAKSKKVRAATSMIMFGGLMQHFWNMVMAGDDDDGENAYLSLLRNRPYNLERQFVFFLPGRSDYVSFPLPYGYNAFHHLGVQGGAMTTGHQDPVAGLLTSMRVAFDAFNPIGSGSLTTMVAPTIADPWIEIETNKNFFGAPIYPETSPFDPAPPPESQRSRSSTNSLAIAIAEGMNKATGGDEIVPGAIDVHPGTLEHVWGFFTGGIGRFGMKTYETATRGVQGEFEPTKTPWLRSFYGQTTEDNARSEYYRQKEAVFTAYGRYNDYRDTGDQKAAERFYEDHRVELEAHQAFKSIDKSLRKLRKKRRAIEGDKSLSAAQREQELETINEDEQYQMREARKAFQEARERHQ